MAWWRNWATQIWVNIHSGKSFLRLPYPMLTYPKAISQEIPHTSVTQVSLKITYLKFHINLQGVSKLSSCTNNLLQEGTYWETTNWWSKRSPCCFNLLSFLCRNISDCTQAIHVFGLFCGLWLYSVEYHSYPLLIFVPYSYTEKWTGNYCLPRFFSTISLIKTTEQKHFTSLSTQTSGCY